MIWPLCKQEVHDPSRNTVEMQWRASDHIERCDRALKNLKGIVFG